MEVRNQQREADNNATRVTDHKIIAFYFKLADCAGSPNVKANEKEMKLINNLESMLDAVTEGRSVNEKLLANARYKMSRVACFSERYLEIVRFLEAYQQKHRQAS